jgi:cytochrome c oxidase subunit 4
MNSVDATTPADPRSGSPGESGQESLCHVVPLWVLLGIWAILVLLTAATVAVTYVDLGTLNLWIAMIIATAKASLVALYFMHLRYDHPLYGVILITALLFMTLFIGLVLVDVAALPPSEITGG